MTYKDPQTVCAPWVDTDTLCACLDGTTVDCEDGEETELTYPFTDGDLVLAASNILFAKTCYQFPGVCTREIYPCLECWHRVHPCGCGLYESIPLPNDLPVLAVSEVAIDGVALDAADYRVDDWSRLIRLDGEVWPRANNLEVPDGTCVNLKITFTFGIEPPIELQMAATELACQMKRACNDESCTIDARVGETVRKLQRRGVDIETESLQKLMTEGSMGNDIIDRAIAAHECGHSGAVDPAAVRRRLNVQVDTKP